MGRRGSGPVDEVTGTQVAQGAGTVDAHAADPHWSAQRDQTGMPNSTDATAGTAEAAVTGATAAPPASTQGIAAPTASIPLLAAKAHTVAKAEAVD